MEENYRGKHERKDWQQPRYFGKHEKWIRAEDAKGYVFLRNDAPVSRTYGREKTLHVSGNDPRRRIIRQAFSFQDPGMVHRAIPAEGIVKPYSPIWKNAPQANYWLGETKRRGIIGRMLHKK